MHAYAAAHDPGLLNLTRSSAAAADDPAASARHCVVHYRVGDVVTQGAKMLPAPSSLAAAVAGLAPSSVHILSSGMNHLCPHAKDCRGRSQRMLQALAAGVRRRLPGVTVHVQLEEALNHADADFYRMALAPMLVTSTGSFAMAAAIASTGQVRTPACKQMSLCRPQMPPKALRPGWQTYAFEAVDERNIERELEAA